MLKSKINSDVDKEFASGCLILSMDFAFEKHGSNNAI